MQPSDSVIDPFNCVLQMSRTCATQRISHDTTHRKLMNWEGKQTMTLKVLVTRRKQVEGKGAGHSEEHLGVRKYCKQ